MMINALRLAARACPLLPGRAGGEAGALASGQRRQARSDNWMANRRALLCRIWGVALKGKAPVRRIASSEKDAAFWPQLARKAAIKAESTRGQRPQAIGGPVCPQRLSNSSMSITTASPE